MICLICRQSEIVDQLTSVKFERSGIHSAISNVPARVCPSCGEAYVAEEVARQLLRVMKKLSEAGTLDAYCEYNTALI
jgi:YgiT-type zinc finger domain-containing protein